MKNFGYTLTGSGNIALMLDNKPFTIDSSHQNYTQIRESLRNFSKVGKVATIKSLRSLVDIPHSICTYAQNQVEIVNGQVFYNGAPLHNFAATRLLEMQRGGDDYTALGNFLNKIMANPSDNTRESAYAFLEKGGFPLTEDGDFLAYKKINRGDWTDKHTGTISNKIGTTVKMDRSKVVDDPGTDCSYGLHVGNLEFVQRFGDNDDRIVIVKVNPGNVVSVPNAYEVGKVRVCEYQVVAELNAEATASFHDGTDILGLRRVQKRDELGRFVSAFADDFDAESDEDDEDSDEGCRSGSGPKRNSRGQFCR